VDDWHGTVKELVVGYGEQPKPAMLISRRA
jgi:hypothetical protein